MSRETSMGAGKTGLRGKKKKGASGRQYWSGDLPGMLQAGKDVG